MKIKNFIITFWLILFLFISCSEEDSEIDVKELLISTTWINDSFFDPSFMNGYKEDPFHNEYTFFENGTYFIKGIGTQDSYNGDVQDTVECIQEWSFDANNNIIEFISNSNDKFIKNYDWKITDINSNEMKVILSLSPEVQIDYRILLKSKN